MSMRSHGNEREQVVPAYENPPEAYLITAAELADKKAFLEQRGVLDSKRSAQGNISIEIATIPKTPEAGPDSNQDAGIGLIGPGQRWFLGGVMDGVGGKKGGRLASQGLKAELKTQFKGFNPVEGQDNIGEMLSRIQAAIDIAGPKAKDAESGADTTMCLTIGCLVMKNGKFTYECFTVNAGDSRAYSVVGEGVRQETIDDTEAVRDKGKKEFAAFSDPGKNVITSNAFDPTHYNANRKYPKYAFAITEVNVPELAPGQPLTFYNMSDGLTDNMRDDRGQNTWAGEDLNLLPYREISRRMRGGTSAEDLVLSARVRIDEGMRFIDNNDAGALVTVGTKPDDIVATKMTVFPPEGLELPKVKSETETIVAPAEKQLRGILAYFVWGDSEQRENIKQVNLAEVLKEFQRLYPTCAAFEKEIPAYVKNISPLSRVPVYKQKLLQLVHLIYGKDVTLTLSLYR